MNERKMKGRIGKRLFNKSKLLSIKQQQPNAVPQAQASISSCGRQNKFTLPARCCLLIKSS